GDEIEALQTKYMIESNCSRITHRRPQHVAKWLELSRFKGDRIEGGETPVLSAAIERVGRGADRHARYDRFLIAPGVEAVAANAARDIKIKSDRQPARFASGPTALELLVRRPLHEFKEPDGRSLLAVQPVESLGIRRAPLLRPFPPRAC